MYSYYAFFFSDLSSISYGVPQGSILEPLLFLIYVNDIRRLNLKSKLMMYADEADLYYSHHDWMEALAVIREDFIALLKWPLFYCLTISFSKSNFLVFCKKQQETHIRQEKCINVEGVQLDRVWKYIYLGALLDPELKFELALNSAYKKFSITHTLSDSLLFNPK